MKHRLKTLEKTLMCAVECAACDLAHADAAEMGEVVDMIKDIEEALYYHVITEAMLNKDEEEEEVYSKRERKWEDDDEYEGHSYKNRRMYMEAREMKKDKATQLRELEKYMQELTSDMVDMIQDASAEEKQYLEKKIAALATKIGQMK